MLKKNGLFARLFAAFFTAMLAVVCVFAFVLARGMQESAQESYEREVTMQAREVAGLLSYMSRLTYIRSNSALLYMLTEKTEYINRTYQADIWLVSFDDAGVQVQYLDNNLRTSYAMFSEAVRSQLEIVRTGSEIRVVGLFPELGEKIVTIGVPWMYEGSVTVGAVLLHISVDSLRVDYAGLPEKLLPFAAISLVLALATSYFIARSQSRPIARINDAMKRFAAGDFGSRANVDGNREIRELADSYNRMASQIAEAEESRRSFVAAVSHELRSPLTSMRGYVQAILDGTIEGDSVKKYLGVVMDESVRLTDLVSDLLDLSRLESGSFPMEISPFDLSELVRRTLITFEKRIDEAGMSVTLDMPEEDVTALGDMKRISQVIANLIDNAVKYGGKALTVSLAVARGRVRVTVHDDGEGISPDDLPHIFDRFYKADKAHTSGKGTGLGLSIARRIVEQHSSTLTCESGDGKGTSFAFDLECAKPDASRG